MGKYLLSQVNRFTQNEFVKIFGNIVEQYEFCAYSLYLRGRRPYRSVQDFIDDVKKFLDNLSDTEKVKILNLHPDLAGKINRLESLTDESQKEQKSAGLDHITPRDAEELHMLNTKYKARFGFPFIICARENKIAAIINGLRRRLENCRNDEIETAIEEVKKIATYRILEIVNG